MKIKISLLFIIVLFPAFVFAAQLKFRVVPNTNSSDGATMVEVTLDSNEKNINVIDGVISIKAENVGNLYVNPNTEGSILTLWPTPPQFSSSDGLLHFVGGVPNGWTGEEVLFSIRLSAQKDGKATVSWSDGHAYINDGKGTMENVTSEPISVDIKSIRNKPSDFFKQKIFIGVIILLIFIFSFFVFHANKKSI